MDTLPGAALPRIYSVVNAVNGGADQLAHTYWQDVHTARVAHLHANHQITETDVRARAHRAALYATQVHSMVAALEAVSTVVDACAMVRYDAFMRVGQLLHDNARLREFFTPHVFTMVCSSV